MGGKGGGSAPSQTPAEQMAYSAAQPYLQEYNSGKLNANDQALVNEGDTNRTGATLQSFASAGMRGSSTLGELVGVVTKGTSTQGMQAGAGSAEDLAKLSNEQAILQSDLQTGMAYLQISSGQAADLAGVQQEQQEMLANALGSAASSAGSILGEGGTSEGSGATPSDAGAGNYSQIGNYSQFESPDVQSWYSNG